MNRKMLLTLISISVLLLAAAVALFYLPGDREEEAANDSIAETEETETNNEPSNVTNDEVTQGTEEFIKAWYNEADRDVLEEQLGAYMTEDLRERYFGSIPTPANEGGSGEKRVEYSRNFDNVSIYTSQEGSSYSVMYDVEFNMVVDDQDAIPQRIIGSMEMTEQDGSLLISNFEEVATPNVQAE